MKIHSGAITIESAQGTCGYLLEETISEGRVFVLTKARCGTKYVILKTTRTQDAIHQEILRREYEIGKNLSHGCVVSTIDFAEDTPVGAAIVLEYIDGVTLREYLSDPSTGIEAKKKPILNDILSGVDYLHHRGILHNDIKPDNMTPSIILCKRNSGLNDSSYFFTFITILWKLLCQKKKRNVPFLKKCLPKSF